MNDWNKIKKKNLGEIPHEASTNISSPELAPSDGRITGRTKQLNLKVKEETYWLLKEIALKQKKLMTEILEKALMEYKKTLFSETKNSVVSPNQPIAKIPTNNYQDEPMPAWCSFFLNDEFCDNPIFDKKKQLCRSHNRQVRKRFNEFTKNMSISSTAAWEMQWEQSGDWRYFWNLLEKNGKK